MRLTILILLSWSFLPVYAGEGYAPITGSTSVMVPDTIAMTGGSSEIGWKFDINLEATYRYDILGGQPVRVFFTRLTLNSMTSTSPVQYTDPTTGITINAPQSFSADDSVLD